MTKKHTEHSPTRTATNAFRRLLTPRELVRFRAGNGALISSLYMELGAALLREGSRHVSNPDDLDDLVQETWTRAYMRRATFRGYAPIFEWLRSILTTTATDRVRRSIRRRTQAQTWLATSVFGYQTTSDVLEAVDIHSTMARTEQRHLLIHALTQLPPRQSDVAIARYLGGLSVRKTAQTLGMAEGTVKATLAQATERLRQLLAPNTKTVR